VKLLFVYYAPSGGMETLNRLRCKALKAVGIECHQLYLQGGTGLQNVWNIPTYVRTHEEEIAELLQKEAFDVILVTCNYHLVPRLRSMGFGGTLIFEAQGFGYGSKKAAEGALQDARGYLDGAIQAVFYPPTPHLMELFRSFYPSLPHFCFNTPLDTEVFYPRSLPHYPNPILGWVGRIEDNKNWSEFLDIGYRLGKQVPGLELWMFEDPSLSVPEERLRFEHKVSELQLGSRLALKANVPHSEMPEAYSRIGDSGGLLLSTSKIEAAPYAVLEAMSCRCPVLVTDSDGVRIFVKHRETGSFYPIGQVEAAIMETLELMNNAPLREAIRSKALAKVRQEFTLEAYASNFIAILQALGTG